MKISFLLIFSSDCSSKLPLPVNQLFTFAFPCMEGDSEIMVLSVCCLIFSIWSNPNCLHQSQIDFLHNTAQTEGLCLF